MRPRALLFALLLAVVAAGCGGGDEDTVGTEAPTYEVDLPSGWMEAPDADKQIAADQAGAAVDSAFGDSVPAGVVVTSLWLDGDFRDLETSNMAVIREPIPEGVSFDEFVEVSIANLDDILVDGAESPPEALDGTEVAGEPAPTFEYEIEGLGVPTRSVVIQHEGYAYTLTLNSTPGNYKAGVAALNEIAATWEWTD